MDNMRAITLLLKYRTTTYTLIFEIFFLHKDAQNPFATSNFSAAKNVHNTRENRQRLRHFFLVTFIIEESREKQIIKTKFDI